MFTKNAHYLATVAISNEYFCGGSCDFDVLFSRKNRTGILLKDSRGDEMSLRTKKSSAQTHVILHSYQELFGKESMKVRVLEDEILSKRLVHYIKYYYGESKTNCSAFAEYLRTGKFVECCDENNYFAFTGGMNSYTGQPVRAGDTVCILYYNKNAKSRKAPGFVRNHYRKVSQKVIDGDFSDLKGPCGTYSSNQILGMYRSGYIEDYHFMFCIGVEHGEPVFVQQLGWQDPLLEKDPRSSPIIVSVGMRNISPKDTPSHVFIKKGRN